LLNGSLELLANGVEHAVDELHGLLRAEGPGQFERLVDYDGRRPDWGRHKIDFSVLPAEWIDLFRTGIDLEIQWLTTLAARARKFRKKIPELA